MGVKTRLDSKSMAASTTREVAAERMPMGSLGSVL